MFRKKIFSVVIPIIIGMCISVIPYQENMAGETSNKSVSVQSSGEPSGDAQVISEETEDENSFFAEMDSNNEERH